MEASFPKSRNPKHHSGFNLSCKLYVAGVLHVFEGGKLEIHDKYSFDFPPIRSQDGWNEIRTDLFKNAEIFAEAIENIHEEQLGEYFVLEKYGTYRRNIEGMIAHCYYHLGQISLIKKLTSTKQ